MTYIEATDLTLFLTKPDNTTIGKLIHVNNRELIEKDKDVYELSFILPYMITVDGEQHKNPHVKNV